MLWWCQLGWLRGQAVGLVVRGARLLIIATYRDVGPRRGHPLSQTLGELAREGFRQGILMRGLSERDVNRLIEIPAGIQVSHRLTVATRHLLA